MKKKIFMLFSSVLFCSVLFTCSKLNAQGPPMWNLNGNAPTVNSFIGTTNTMDLVLKTNNQDRVIIKGNTGGFRIISLQGSGNALVKTDPNGELSRINFPNNYQYVLDGTGNFVTINSLVTSSLVNSLVTPVNVNALTGWKTNASSVTLYNPNTNVGIGGNPDPTNKLEIFGNTKIHGELLADSVKIGDSSIIITSKFESPFPNNIYSTPTNLYPGGTLGINCRINSPSTVINAYNGKVVIGGTTTTTTAKLDVYGNTKINGGVIISGNVGIGTTCPVSSLIHKLTVEGTIAARKVIVESANWCDFVFENDYKLMSYENLRAYIKENKHLPNIPSEAEIIKNGIDVSEILKGHTQTIEEMVLYILELEGRINALETKYGNK